MNCLKKEIILLLVTEPGYMATDAPLLPWSGLCTNDNSTPTITVDVTKYYYQELLEDANPDNKYKYGCITNGPGNNGGQRWRRLKAVAPGDNKCQYTNNNIRSVFRVPQGETDTNVKIPFREVNLHPDLSENRAHTGGSSIFLSLYPAVKNHVHFIQPFIVPTFNPPMKSFPQQRERHAIP